MAGKVKQAVAAALVIAGFLIFLSFGMQTFQALPDDATVIVDPDTMVYATFACIRNGTVSPDFFKSGEYDSEVNSKKMGTVRLLKGKGMAFKPDPVCRDANGFMTNFSSIGMEAIKVVVGFFRRSS